MKFLLLPAVLAAAAVSFAAGAAPPNRAAPAVAPVDTGDASAAQSLLKLDPPERVAQRLRWWNEARFGMFIHWGLYAQWGCHYPGPDGRLLDGRTEHMMRHLQLPRAQYAKIAGLFNPVKFDADEWARVARDAGMKYMVITSKHHDGFAMFHSPGNDYNIVARTPWRRDPVKELAAACRRHGLRFGVYYSLGRDWDDPDVPTRDGYRSNTWDYPDEARKDFARYFERKVKPQVRELLTQYGPIAVLWFDTPERIAKEQSIELLRLIHQLQPDCIVNQRVGNRYGDYRVAEQTIPAGGYADAWETCMTLNRHWGYYFGDDEFKPALTVVRNLVDIASKGGNFLLNVGPTDEGVIPAGSVARLREVGQWLARNGAAIYGTSASPLGKLAWGRCTLKNTADGAILYLHVFDWPADGRLVVPGVRNAGATATLLADGRTLKTATDGRDIAVTVPAAAPDPISSTIALKLKGPLLVASPK